MKTGTTTPVATPALGLGESLAAATYLRERSAPRLCDVNYLYFTDLLHVTRQLAAEIEGTLFDYGCGGAPYQRIFGRCQSYVRADITPGPGLDRLLPADGKTRELSDSYDTVLSSQVLEHVKDPHAYIAECHRILKPAGRLILTTHGMFEEHGCPFDFQRWTCRGLEELVRAHGFVVDSSFKVTVEARAAIQLCHHFMAHLRYRENPLLHYALAVSRKIHRWVAVPILNWLGQRFTRHQVVPADDSITLYVGVAVLAKKRVR